MRIPIMTTVAHGLSDICKAITQNYICVNKEFILNNINN